VGNYIYLVSCPLTGEVKHINADRSPKIDILIRRDEDYISWRELLRKRKKTVEYKIIEKCEIDCQEVLEFYRWLFKSWNIYLFEHKYFDKANIHLPIFSTSLSRNFRLKKRKLSINHKVVNNKILLYLLKDMIEIRFSNRIYTEFTALLILVFIVGFKYPHYEDVNFWMIKGQIKAFRRNNGTGCYSKLITYLEHFLNFYDDNSKKSIPYAFTKIKCSQPYIDNALNKALNYFGYGIEFSFTNGAKLSDYFRIRYFTHFKEQLPRDLVQHFNYGIDNMVVQDLPNEHKVSNDYDIILNLSSPEVIKGKLVKKVQ